jgi:hypothetical protein
MFRHRAPSGGATAADSLGQLTSLLYTSLRSAHGDILGCIVPQGRKLSAGCASTRRSITTHGSPPNRHPRRSRGCRFSGEGAWVCPTPGITIPGMGLPSLRDSRAMPFRHDRLVYNNEGCKPWLNRGLEHRLVPRDVKAIMVIHKSQSFGFQPFGLAVRLVYNNRRSPPHRG